MYVGLLPRLSLCLQIIAHGMVWDAMPFLCAIERVDGVERPSNENGHIHQLPMMYIRYNCLTSQSSFILPRKGHLHHLYAYGW